MSKKKIFALATIAAGIAALYKVGENELNRRADEAADDKDLDELFDEMDAEDEVAEEEASETEINESYEGESIIDMVSDAAAVVKVGFDVTTEKIKSSIEEYKEDPEAFKQKAREYASDKADDAKDFASDKYEIAKEYATEKYEVAKEFATEKYGEAKEYATEKYGEAKEYATEKIDAAKEVAAEKYEEVKEFATEKYEEAKEFATEKIESLRDNPFADDDIEFEEETSKADPEYLDIDDEGEIEIIEISSKKKDKKKDKKKK